MLVRGVVRQAGRYKHEGQLRNEQVICVVYTIMIMGCACAHARAQHRYTIVDAKVHSDPAHAAKASWCRPRSARSRRHRGAGRRAQRRL